MLTLIRYMKVINDLVDEYLHAHIALLSYAPRCVQQESQVYCEGAD